VHSGLPRPEAFPGFVAPAIADTMPRGWVHAALKAGHALVLVDGLDEIPASQREDVSTWLNDLVETYPAAHYIITSRPHAIEDGWMDHEGLQDAELQPMERADIFAFIDHWHEAVREELQTEEERRELAPLAEHLKDQVRRTHTIRTLATSPLLCAMLCALNRERRRQLPVNRIELYRACCALLLERRDKDSHVDLSDYPALHYGQKQRLLEDLAYWMLQQDLSEVDLAVVDARFTQKLAQMPGVSQEVTGAQVRRLLVERGGSSASR
jgi:predicted NACHT family NTPase